MDRIEVLFAAVRRSRVLLTCLFALTALVVIPTMPASASSATLCGWWPALVPRCRLDGAECLTTSVVWSITSGPTREANRPRGASLIASRALAELFRGGSSGLSKRCRRW